MGIMALQLEKELKIGDTIHILGQSTDITQTVDSILLEHLPVRTAKPGEHVGIKIEERVHPGDTVYKILP